MSRLKTNILFQVAYQILNLILPIISAPYVARVLGADGVGVYSYTYSIVSYFVLFAKLGIHVYGNRTIALTRNNKNELDKTFSELFFIHAIASVIAVILLLFYITVASSEYTVIFIIQTLYVIAEVFDVNWLFFGLEQFKTTVTRNTVIKIVTAVCIFLFINSADDVWLYCLIMALGTFVSEIILWKFLPQHVSFVKVSFKESSKHIIPLISFFIPSVAVSVYKIMDKIMLGSIAGTIQVGYYENSEKIVSVAMSVITSVGTVMMPYMAGLIAENNKEKEKDLIVRSLEAICIAACAMTFGIIGIANTFPEIFYGKEFSECGYLMSGLAISLLFTAFANVIRTQYLIPHKKDRAFLSSVCIGAIVNLVINMMLIPRLYAMGAVIGTVVAEATVCIIQMTFSKNELPIWKILKSSIPYMLLGGLMCIICRIIGYCLDDSVTTLVIQVGSGVIIYIIGILIIWKVTGKPLVKKR